jgi:hypothetical protein
VIETAVFAGLIIYVETAMHCAERESGEWKFEFGATIAVICIFCCAEENVVKSDACLLGIDTFQCIVTWH